MLCRDQLPSRTLCIPFPLSKIPLKLRQQNKQFYSLLLPEQNCLVGMAICVQYFSYFYSPNPYLLSSTTGHHVLTKSAILRDTFYLISCGKSTKGCLGEWVLRNWNSFMTYLSGMPKIIGCILQTIEPICYCHHCLVYAGQWKAYLWSTWWIIIKNKHAYLLLMFW